MKYARVEWEVVQEIYETDDPEDPIITNPAQIWVDVTGMDPQPQPSWVATQTNTGWVLTPPPDPFLRDRPVFMEIMHRQRENIFNRVGLIAALALYDNDFVTMEAIKVAHRAMLDIEEHPSVIAATNLNDLATAVVTLYRAIVADLPASLRESFNEVDR